MKKFIFTLSVLAVLHCPLLVSGNASGDRPAAGVVVFHGVVAEGVECNGIRTCDNSEFYVTGNLQGFSIGDEVFVVGRVRDGGFNSICMQGPRMGVLHMHLSPCQ